ncbi:hypothetical protein KIW84_050811 [Lathyrus oleraceus]|uniref:Uncharacterized protein n=1 Tax=Pisum sativum TaxID=3888 RepID=A0A9D4WKB0_PEA|nr:hypothetical protein KIW84_050811 [Pisum sativum]
MRRCQDTVFELESFLEREHGFVVPSYWRWDPHTPSVHDKNMKKVILASLSENVAMFFGRNQLGYEVAQTGQHVQLHPSSSLLVFAQKPSWVVFGDLLSVSNEYLVCVSAVEFQSLYDLQPPPSFDVSKMEERKLQTKTLTGFGTILLKRFCGKSNSNLLGHVSRIRKACLDERIFVEVKVDENLIQLYNASHDMNTATMLVSDVLEYEKKRLHAECMEKCLYHGSSSASPMALFGSGAEIKHLELEKHSLSSICAVYKFQGMGKDPPDREKWGKITFLSPDAAKRAVELDGDEFCGSNLKILPSQSAMGGDKTFLFPEVNISMGGDKTFYAKGSSQNLTMPIHSSNHSLTSYTTVVIVVLLFLQTSTPIIKALAENSHVTNFQSPNLYPESLAWDPLKQHFLVGSLRHRTISSISDAGIIETLISDTSLPENVTVVGITVDSRNNRVLAVIHAVKPLPPFNALAAYDLKYGNRLFLSPLPTDEEALANNVAVDYNDNAYVTNSIGNYIWKVNVKGEAPIFSKSPRFTEHPVDRDTPYSYIGLNGIAYVSSGDYLLVVQSNTGKVFKVDADDGTARHVLLNEDLTRPDGVVFRSDGVVLVVSPQANNLWLLKSNNGWREGVVYDKIDLESEGYPTSVVSRGRDKMYVLYGYFLEGLLGNSEREGFRIEEIMSPKESEGENVWLYVMIGFGMVYFVYWRFQMGQLVKHMNKKIN